MTTPYVPTSKPRNYRYATLEEAKNNNKKYAPGSKIFIDETETTITHRGRFPSALSEGEWSQSTKETVRCRLGDIITFDQNLVGVTSFTTNVDFNLPGLELIMIFPDTSTSRPWQKVFLDLDAIKIREDIGDTIRQGLIAVYDNDHIRFAITDRDTGTFTLNEIGRDFKLLSVEITQPKEIFVESVFNV